MTDQEIKDAPRSNVKNIFFIDGDSFPCFELENGETKYPYSTIIGIYDVLGWCTLDEFEKKKKIKTEQSNRPWYKKYF